MQNQAFYRTGIFGNFFFGGEEFCVFKTGIPGGPVFDLEWSEVYKIAVFVTDLAILAYTKGLFYYAYIANKFQLLIGLENSRDQCFKTKTKTA